MKIIFSIVLLFLLINSIELTYDDEIEEIKDLFEKKFPRNKFRMNNDDDDDDDDDDDEYTQARSQHRQSYPSRKKIQKTNDDDDDDSGTETYNPSKGIDDDTCIDKYELKSERLVKVKELKNGAHMIRFVVLDKRTLPSKYNIKEYCMMSCCAQKSCDLAMLSDKPAHEGYKCYLFACNGSCTFATHEDYTVIVPKADSTLYSNSVETKVSPTTTEVPVKASKPSSFFMDTSVIIFLIFGLVSTICLIVFLVRYCRDSLRRGRRNKNYEVDADYLINGLYL